MEMTSRVDEWLVEMRAYETHLDSELRKVRQMLSAIAGVEAKSNTSEMVLDLLRDNAGQAFTAAEVETEIRAQGWVTTSEDPVNAVRATLTRLKNANEIESVGRGQFQFREDEDSDPWGKPPRDDPWGSPPPPTTGPQADDEPPF